MDKIVRILFIPSRRIQEKEWAALQDTMRSLLPFGFGSTVEDLDGIYQGGILSFRREGLFYSTLIDSGVGEPIFPLHINGERIDRKADKRGLHSINNAIPTYLSQFIEEFTGGEPWQDWGLQQVNGYTYPGVAWLPARISIDKPELGSYISLEGIHTKDDEDLDLIYIEDVDMYGLPNVKQPISYKLPLYSVPESWELPEQIIKSDRVDSLHNLHNADRTEEYYTLPSLRHKESIGFRWPPLSIVENTSVPEGVSTSLKAPPSQDIVINGISLQDGPTSKEEFFSRENGIEIDINFESIVTSFELLGIESSFAYEIRTEGSIVRGIATQIATLDYPLKVKQGDKLFVTSYGSYPLIAGEGPGIYLIQGNSLKINAIQLSIIFNRADLTNSNYKFTIQNSRDRYITNLQSYISSGSSLSIPNRGSGSVEILSEGIVSFWGEIDFLEILPEGTIVYNNEWLYLDGVEVEIKHYLPDNSSIEVWISIDSGYNWIPCEVVSLNPSISLWKADVQTDQCRVRVDLKGSSQAMPQIYSHTIKSMA